MTTGNHHVGDGGGGAGAGDSSGGKVMQRSTSQHFCKKLQACAELQPLFLGGARMSRAAALPAIAASHRNLMNCACHLQLVQEADDREAAGTAAAAASATPAAPASAPSGTPLAGGAAVLAKLRCVHDM